MKYFFTILGTLFVLICFVAFSCKPNPVEKLIKTWKPVDAKGAGVNAVTKESIVKEGNRMEFKKDGMIISFSADRGNDTGTYKLTGDGKILLINSSNKNERKIKVIELKSNRLIIENHGLILVLEPSKN